MRIATDSVTPVSKSTVNIQNRGMPTRAWMRAAMAECGGSCAGSACGSRAWVSMSLSTFAEA